jgi:bifunctional DNase/RNase
MSVQVELKRIIITEDSDQQVIYLKEVAGERAFPIVIGNNEAFAIDRRLKGQPTPRPYTHELLASVIERLEGKLERIVINDLQDHTFYARLVIRHGGKMIEIDCRPSDAIALGIAGNVPIFVADHVMNEVSG